MSNVHQALGKFKKFVNKMTVASSNKKVENVQIYIVIIANMVNHLENRPFLKDKYFGKYVGIAFRY